MTTHQAVNRAAKLGLSAWIAEAAQVGGHSKEFESVKCVGFASIDLPLGQGQTWDEAFQQAARLVFSA